jgi:hypothetical protein
VIPRTLLALAIAAVPLAAAAAPTPAAVSPAPARVRDGGVIDGRIAAVDFLRNQLTLTAGAHRIAFLLMPSTSIQSRDSGYHTVTDLKVGARVEVFSSISGGKYVAQIVRIL